MKEPLAPRSVPDAIRARRAERNFSDRELSEETLAAILDDARHAPSGYNLQPTHFVLVRGAKREPLAAAAFDQRQVREAPVTVVVVADSQSDRAHLEDVLAADLERGAIDEEYADFMRRMVGLSFGRGPLGLVGCAKGVATTLLGGVRPLPRFPASEPAEWAARQAMIAATHVLLSAASRGVSSCPMEGFGEARVRRLLGIPSRYRVTLLIPLGYAKEPEGEAESEEKRRSRLPLDRLVHDGGW